MDKTSEEALKCLPEEDQGGLRLGWKFYEEIYPVANDPSVFYDGYDIDLNELADAHGPSTHWMDGSRKNLKLRYRIIDRVSDLLEEADVERGNPNLMMRMCFLCRDACETEEEIAAWRLPKRMTS